MIKIKINPNLFEANGQFKKSSPFYGIDPQKAIILVSTGKSAEGWVKAQNVGRSDNDSIYDGTNSLKIGESGVEMTDTAFYYIINNEEIFVTFGMQIVSLVEQGHIEVSQNGTPLLVSGIVNFSLA